MLVVREILKEQSEKSLLITSFPVSTTIMRSGGVMCIYTLYIPRHRLHKDNELYQDPLFQLYTYSTTPNTHTTPKANLTLLSYKIL